MTDSIIVVCDNTGSLVKFHHGGKMKITTKTTPKSGDEFTIFTHQKLDEGESFDIFSILGNLLGTGKVTHDYSKDDKYKKGNMGKGYYRAKVE